MTDGPPQASRGELISVHESATRFFCDMMPGSWVPGYLAVRGFGPGVQERWQAGYAPAAWDTLTRHLRSAGYPDALIEAAGLARRSRHGSLTDTFRDRVMLPIRSADGVVVAFIGRAPEHAGPGVPKYLNSPGTGLYSKSALLFGLWEGQEALAGGARPVIVEGPFDAIAVTTACHGRYVGAAPCGAVLTDRQAAALSRVASLAVTGVLVAFDPDQAGHRAAVSAYRLLAPLTEHALAVVLPAGQDPAQILRDHGPAALVRVLDSRTRPLADLAVDAEVSRWSPWLRHAEGQISALRAAAPLVAMLPSAQVARQVGRLADRLGLDHAIVTEAVTAALTEVMAAGQAALGGRSAAPRADPRHRHAAAVRAASRDSPASLRQAITQAATAPSGPGQAGSCVPRSALRARRVPG